MLFKKLATFTIRTLLISLVSTFVAFPQGSQAAIAGKTQLLPTWASGNDWLVVDSVGIKKQTPSGLINTPITFIPYYVLGTNSGTVASVDTTTVFATLAYAIKDPNGALLANFPMKQDISAIGSLDRLANKRAVQTNSTNGNSIMFFPDKVGNYSITIWHDYNENLVLDSNETTTTEYITIYDKSKLTVSVTNYGSGLTGSFIDNSYGYLTKICVANNSTVTGLNFMSGFSVVSNSSTEYFDSISKWVNGNFEMSDAGNPTAYNLTSDNFGDNGCAYINHYNSAATPGTVRMTITALSGELKDSTYTTSFAYLSTDIYPISGAASRVVTNASNLKTTYSSSSSATASAAGTDGTPFEVGVPILSGVSFYLSTNTDAVDLGTKGRSILMRVVDTDGAITGLKGASYMVAASSSISATSPYSVTSPAFYAYLSRTQSFMIYVQGNNSLLGGSIKGTVAVQVKPQDRFAKSMIGNPPVLRGKIGETIITYLQVRDQFGYLMPYTNIFPIVTGRNTNQDDVRAWQTDQYGRIRWLIKDLGTNPNSFTDIVTGKDLSGQFLLGSGLTIYYNSVPEVASIKITGAASEDKENQYTKSFIDTSYSGANNTTVKMTATLFDKNGSQVPAGIKVKWSTKGLDGKTVIPTDSSTGDDYTSTYTDVSGSTSTYIYSWGTGDVNVFAEVDTSTATINIDSATVISPGIIHFSNKDTDARIITASSSQGWIRAKVIDRYGNPVSGVSLTITRVSGKGYIPYQGTARVTDITDSNGEIEYAVTGGDATFRVETTTDYFGQTSSLAGEVNGIAISASSAGSELSIAGIDQVIIDVKSRDLEGEVLAAAQVATAAADKTNAASNIAAEKADNAMLKAQEVNQQIIDISNSVIDATKTFNKTLKSLYKSLQKIKAVIAKQ